MWILPGRKLHRWVSCRRWLVGYPSLPAKRVATPHSPWDSHSGLRNITRSPLRELQGLSGRSKHTLGADMPQVSGSPMHPFAERAGWGGKPSVAWRGLHLFHVPCCLKRYFQQSAGSKHIQLWMSHFAKHITTSATERSLRTIPKFWILVSLHIK